MSNVLLLSPTGTYRLSKSAPRGPRVMQLIIAWKVLKGCVLLMAGVALTLALWRGQGAALHAFALSLREQVTARLAIELAEAFVRAATPGYLSLTSVALGLNGTVILVEAWLLHRGTRLAIWVVVLTSSVLIPWELYEVFAHFRILRVVLLVLNVVVVTYLGLQASKHVAHRKAQTAN